MQIGLLPWEAKLSIFECLSSQQESKTRGNNKAEYIACVAGAWKQWEQEKTGSRACLPRSRAPVLSFSHYFQVPAMQATEYAKY